MPENPTILTQFGFADPNESPVKLNDLIALLNRLVTSTIHPPQTYLFYVIGHDTPGSADQDKIWIYQDTQGRPIEIRLYYHGAWRRVYNGMPGEIRGYTGPPGDPYWDTNGTGKVGELYDGWQICNGKNGSPNLSDRFLIGGHMDNSASHEGYDGGWQALSVPGLGGDGNMYKVGGRWKETITMNNVPELSNAGSGEDPGLWLHGYEAKDGALHSSAVPLVDENFANLKPHNIMIANYGKNPPDPIWTVDPFYALAWITFKGYL